MDVNIIPFQGVPESAVLHLVQDLQPFNIHALVGSTASLPKEAFNEHKRQYIADQVLAFLTGNYQERVLGIIGDDMYRYILDYIKGFADLPGRCAVISVYRLQTIKDELKYRSHLCELALHELGHTLGLEHCKDDECVMYQGQLRNPLKYHYCPACTLKSGILV